MFDKLRKWNLNRKLVKAITKKNVNHDKIKQLLLNKAQLSKIIDCKKKNNFDLMKFANCVVNEENESIKLVLLKQVESFAYKQFQYNIINNKSKQNKSKESKKIKEILQKFGIKFDKEIITIIEDLQTNKFCLKEAHKQANFFQKIIKFISFNKYRTKTENEYWPQIKNLQSSYDVKTKSDIQLTSDSNIDVLVQSKKTSSRVDIIKNDSENSKNDSENVTLKTSSVNLSICEKSQPMSY